MKHISEIEISKHTPTKAGAERHTGEGPHRWEWSHPQEVMGGDGQQGLPIHPLSEGMLQGEPKPEQQEGICLGTTHLKRQTNKQTKIHQTLPSTSSAHKDNRIAELYSQNSNHNKMTRWCSSWACFWTEAGTITASVWEQGLFSLCPQDGRFSKPYLSQGHSGCCPEFYYPI